MGPRIRATGLTKRYRLGEGWGRRATLREHLAGRLRRSEVAERSEVVAVNDLSFSIGDGESVGLIGPNGAGKSTLLKLVAGITRPSAGSAGTRGRVGCLLEVGAGFHPELTGRENVHLNGAILGMTRREVARRFDDIVAISGVERFLDTPVKRYSSGMYLRLAFGVAANLDADILLVDEVLAVGDAEFQRRCLHRLEELSRAGRTIVFASHDLDAVARVCRRCLHLESGDLAADGASPAVVGDYLSSRLAGGPALAGGTTGVVRDVAVSPRAEELRSRRPFDLDVEVEAPADVHDAQVGVRVSSISGVRVVDETCTIPNEQAGPVRLRLSVPGVLNAGVYVVGVWVGTPERDLAWVEDAVTFRLDGPTEGRPDRVLNLAAPWTVL